MILNYENGTRSRRLYYVVELRLMRRRGDKTNVKHDVIVHLFLKVLGRSKQTSMSPGLNQNTAGPVTLNSCFSLWYSHINST